MLAKSIPNRRRTGYSGTDFQQRLTYLERPDAICETANILGGWHSAADEMQAITGLNPRVRDPVWHIVLSVIADGLPTPEAMIGATRRVMRHLGASQHQYAVAVHPDPEETPFGPRRIHAHVLLNRVHPLTLHVLSRSQDWMRLEWACRIVEREFGWPQDRGRMIPVEVNGELKLMPPSPEIQAARRRARMAGERPMTPAQYGHEADCGLPSLSALWARPVRAAILQVVRRARSWADLHVGLAEHGLLYNVCRGGARIWDAGGRIFAPVSRVSGRMTLSALLHRFGSWQGASNEARRSAVARAGTSISRAIQPDISRLTTWQEAKHDRRAENHLNWRMARYNWDMSVLRVRQQARGNKSPVARAIGQVFRGSLSRFMPKPAQCPPLIAPRGPAATGRLARQRYAAGLDQYLASARQRDALRHCGQIRDHTAARQHWNRCGGDTARRGLGATIRALSDNECLLAARNAGGVITSYTRVSRRENGLSAAPIPGGVPGLICIGEPATAVRIAIYSNPASAVEMLGLLAAETGGQLPPDLAVIVAPEKIEESHKSHLKSIFSQQVILIQKSEIPNRNWEDKLKSCCSENQSLRVIQAPVQAQKILSKQREDARRIASELPVPRPPDG